MGARKGQLFQKRSCESCKALVIAKNPTPEHRYVCSLKYEIEYGPLDDDTLFYAPIKPCPKPRSNKDMKKVVRKMQKA